MRYILAFVLLLGLCVWGANDTRYVDPTSGDNANGGASMVDAWETLAYAFDNHTASSGDTCTIYIKDGETTDDANIELDDGVKQDGINFVLEPETSGGRWTIGNQQAGGYAFRFNTAVTTGSLKLVRADWTTSTSRRLILASNTYGMDVILEDCVITNTTSNSEIYYGPSAAADMDFTVTGDSTLSVAESIYNGGTGAVVIGDGVTLSSSTADKPVIFVQGALDSITIGAATINQTATAGTTSHGISIGAGISLDFISIDGATFDTYGQCLDTAQAVPNYFIRNSTFSSDIDTAITIGGSATAVDNLVIQGNAVSALNTGKRGILLGASVSNFLITSNFIKGDSHALFLKGDNGVISYNTIVAVDTIGLGLFGDNIDVHHNTVYSNGTGTACISGAAGGEAPTVTASVNLKIHDNVFVAANGYAYYDYDASTGLTAPRSAGGGDAMNDYMDYNVYYRVTGTGTVKLGADGSEQECSTQAAMITAWKTATAGGTYWNVNFGDVNDEHSYVQTLNPQLDANYQAKNPQLKNAGSPLLVKSDGTVLLRSDIGATKFVGSGGSRARYGGAY